MSEPVKPIRIMIADAHALVREGLRLLIESKPGIVVVGEAGNASEAVEVATRTQPDMILLELNLNGSSIDFVSLVLDAAKQARLLVVTGVRDARVYSRVVELGAAGIISKEESGEALRKAIDKVYAGEFWLDHSTTANVLGKITCKRNADENGNDEDARIALLSHRERQVISLVGQGLKNKEIAKNLSLSETTVRHHLTTIFSKLGVSNRLELIVYAYRHHLAELPM